MRLAVALTAAASILAVQGCASDMVGSSTSPATAPGATVALADAQGAAKGTATIAETAAGLQLSAKLTGMAPGTYGFHLHTVGKCEAPGFTTAGGHWNPTMKMHGMDNPQGHHMGDIPNVTIGADGAGQIDFTVPGGTLTSGATPLLDADGASLMVHAGPDDYKTDPSGNSGARIACGIVTAG